MHMKKAACSAAAAFAAVSLAVAAPEIEVVSSSQNVATRAVTVTYNLSEEAAVVTFVAQTNNGVEWVDIGTANLKNFDGEVNRLVAVGNNHTATWHPDKSWPNHKVTGGNFRVGLKAWATNAPPDYMVIDLGIRPASVRYYEAEDALPFAITDNVAKQDYLVMRKCHGAGVTWRMGSPVGEPGRGTGETAHNVTFTKDFYVGVYPVTHRQYALMTGGTGTESQWRFPQSNVSYGDFQNTLASVNSTREISLRSPTEAEWEFACRAGAGTAYYNGSNDSSTAGDISWNSGNSGGARNDVGLKTGNDWGFYDMLGNVWEFCSDWYDANYGCDAEDVTDPTGGTSATSHVLKGGFYNTAASGVRCAARSGSSNAQNAAWGFRLAADAMALR